MAARRSPGKIAQRALQKIRERKKAHKKKRSGRVSYDDSKLTSFEAILSDSSGYNAEQILDRALSAAIEVRDGRGSHERDGVVFYTRETNWPLMGAIGLAAATRNRRITVLDFGGSLGTAFFQHKNLLDRFSGIDWRVVEQNNFVEAGRREMKVKGLSFFGSVEEATKGARPLVTYAGSSIQYVEEPMKTLREISLVTSQFLILDRIPVSPDKSRLLRQVVEKHPYDASYPMHVLSQVEIEQSISEHWLLLASHECVGGRSRTSEGFPFEWRGLVFMRKQSVEKPSEVASSR